MKKKIYSHAGRIGCLLLAVIFAASWPTAAAASGKSTKKDETVYINLNASGGVQGTTVSDWLHSYSNAVQIADRSNLSGIQNVKSAVQPSQKGDSLTWAMNGSGSNGSDIYYQGTTRAATPLTVSVSYFLNGKEVTPAQIAGKSGKVKIQVSLKNTDAHTIRVDGQKTEMYTPMTAVVALTLPSDTFRNVKISKGKMISDGNKQFVTFLCMPGLSESLNLKHCGVSEIESIDLPESLTVTADAKDFTLDPIAVVATPELPSEDDLKNSTDLNDMKTDLDKLSRMQSDIEDADPNKDIRSLFTDPDRSAAARLLVDDVFDFYDLDTAALDIMPKYVTDKNISLYDRITSDVDKADLEYVMDNKIIRGLNDRVTDTNVDKVKTLLGDYDDIETFQIGKLDRVIHVLDHYDREYDHLNDALKKAKHIYNRLDDNDLDVLDALSDSDVRDPMKETLDSMDELSSSGLVTPGFRLNDEDVEALMKAIPKDHPDIWENALEGQLSKMEGDYGYISVPKLQSMTKGLDSATQKAIMDKMTSAIRGNAGSKAAIPENVIQELPLPVKPTQEQLEAISDGHGNVYIQKLLPLLPGSMDPSPLISDVLIPENEVLAAMEDIVAKDPTVQDALIGSMMSSTNIHSITNSLNRLLSSSADLQSGLKKELGSDYASRLTDAMANMGHLKGDIDDLKDDVDDLSDKDRENLEDDFDDTKDLLLNKDDMDYMLTWAKKVKSMKTDLDGSTENISILRDLLSLNDDAKIKNFRSMIPTLQKDYDDSRPILDSLKAELDLPANNASLHKLPQTTQTLTKTENDVRSNRKIMEIFRLTTQPKTVSLFNDTFSLLDEFKQKGTTDDMKNKVNDVTTLRDKKDAYTDLSDQYKIFTEAADGAETSVKFVYKTAEIKEPEKVEATPVSTTQKSSQGNGFLGWLRSVWNSAVRTISHLF